MAVRRARGATFAAALAVREFRALWLAELASITGDQFARIALALLIYLRTGSATQTAVTYALTFVPSVLGGALWSGLADRFPRRRLLVVIDCVRAVLAAGMAWPGMSTPILWVLIIALSAGTGPYKGAQGALLAVILPDRDRFDAAVALRQVSGQAAQVLGFVGGGVLLPLVGPSVALASNAGTFALSAVVILTRVTARPAPQPVRHTRHNRREPSDVGEPARGEWDRRDRRGLGLVGIAVALTGLWVLPEGVAPSYARSVHGTAAGLGLGLLLAADPAGSVVGGLLTQALIRRRYLPMSVRTVLALAAAGGVPLIACLIAPSLAASVVLWAICGGLATACLIRAGGMVPTLVPDERRGRVNGRLATTIHASQGIAVLVGGVLADRVGPIQAVAIAGVFGLVVAGLAGGWWRVTRPRTAEFARPAGNLIGG